MRLRPKTYEYRQDFADESGALPAGLQYGFIAQEVERVFPALVTEIEVEHRTPGGRVRRKHIKAVNYQGFIAILVAAIQEQQQALERLAKASADPRRRKH